MLLQQGSPQETTEELRFDEPGPPLLLLSDSTLFQVHDMDCKWRRPHGGVPRSPCTGVVIILWNVCVLVGMEKGRKQEFLAEEASGFILVVHTPLVNSQALQSDLQKAILQHLDGDKVMIIASPKGCGVWCKCASSTTSPCGPSHTHTHTWGQELPPLAVLVMGAEPGSAMQSTLFPGLEVRHPFFLFLCTLLSLWHPARQMDGLPEIAFPLVTVFVS